MLFPRAEGSSRAFRACPLDWPSWSGPLGRQQPARQPVPDSGWPLTWWLQPTLGTVALQVPAWCHPQRCRQTCQRIGLRLPGAGKAPAFGHFSLLTSSAGAGITRGIGPVDTRQPLDQVVDAILSHTLANSATSEASKPGNQPGARL